ncbi:restriction endonuclease subunit S [Lactiplantibacillus plantarum]|uniref:restriction endonuclease subunit S n=1 Tax=Lactiplantibacillus plantarum TaxID=1590 RepID=UPI0012D3D7DE|nr:restriction endonuclease subunit S [Lactiplantibacillus plantarum]QGQ38618.1 restriction endonuclease subunit S [Lactiplantibacillus plantarum]
MSNKVPQIRFNGYSDAWEERKLSDIVSRLSKSSNNSELPRVEFEDIVSGEGRLNKDVSHKFDDRKGILFSSQNILYGKLRPYLKNWLLADFKGIALGDFWVFKSINSDPKFVYSLIQSNHYQKVANDTSGTKMPRSDWKKVSSTEFQIPSSLEEQKKIGSLFKQLDNTIALHQRKLDLLKEQKKGYLQKMFPKNGAKVPELRFAGFADAWEERKLGQYTKLITKGTTPKDKTGIGDVNFVKVENITNGKIYPINKIKQHEHDNYLKRSRLEEKDILFSIAGTLGRTAIVNKSILPANTNQALAIIRGYDFDTNFLITSLAGNVVKEYIRRNPTVGAQPNLSLEQVGNLLVNTPNAEEQQKIGSFFKQLDDTIALHQRELDLLKEQKKGYLQKMFC